VRPPGEAAALIETLARAVEVAHGEGVVHRDLKPANILMSVVRGPRSVGREENPASSGLTTDDRQLTTIPKITDFGLAQPTEGGQTMTQSGFLVGTPGYMAPEQASGKRVLMGPATDIYALGVILYQLLTGQLPFQRDSTLELLRAVTSDEPTRPRHLQPRLPRDLEAITLHCLEKEPSRRYPSALALAEDLERFREGKQVMARPVGAAARLARACRRRPVVALLVALLSVSLLGGMAGVTWNWLEANEQRDLANAHARLADAHARRADAEKQAAQYQTYRASVAAAAGALEIHDVADAARHLESAPEVLRGWEWRHLRSRLDDSSSVIPLPPRANRFAIPEAGFLIAAPDRLWVGVLTGAGLRITDLTVGEQSTLPISPDGWHRINVTQTRLGFRVAACVAGDTAIDVLDDAGRVLCRVAGPEKKPATAFVISPDGTRLACAWDDAARRVAVFDATSGKQSAICAGHRDVIWTLTFSPDGSRLASGAGGDDPTLRLWDAATGTPLATCRGHTGKLHSAAFSPDGSRLVTTSSDRTVRQWDTRTGQEVEPPYDRHASEAYSAAYSPDGQSITSAGADRTIRVWQARGRKDVAVLHGHTGRVVEVAFAPSGRRLASLSRRAAWVDAGDDTVRVWDVDPRATLPLLRGHTSGIYPVAYSPDGRWLASGSWDNTLRLWDAATGEPCATLPHPHLVWGLAFGPDGTWLVSASDDDDRLWIWDVATARVRKRIPFHGKTKLSPTVSSDGTRVAATALDPKNKKNRLSVFDIASGNSLFSTGGSALAYSPDGRWLAVLAPDEKTVLLLDAQTHETTVRLIGHENTVSKAAFSPDGRYLASCGGDRTVRLWQIEPLNHPSPPGEPGRDWVSGCQVLRGHTEEVFAVAFHPNGTRLATAGRDGAVVLWDLARGEEVVRLPWHKSFVWSLAFSPDGATLASGCGDSTVGLWETEPLKARYQARREAAALRPEAELLVEQLWREKNDPAEVVKALRGDRVRSEALRHAALRAVLRLAQPPEAGPRDPHDPP
jgi:YD repeat-containing protein